jgi:uncharacterized protein (TIGR00290 family)
MFSGGKDSVAALRRLRRDAATRPSHLLTTCSDRDHRIALHGTPLELVRAQAEALGLPLTPIPVPDGCDNETYTRAVADALEPLVRDGLREVAFGDLFLSDIRAFRERQMNRLSIRCRFPLWRLDTRELARELIVSGVEALVCGVDLQALPESMLGRNFDARFLEDLPPDCDPCGENGEFHTLVVDAPEMRDRLCVSVRGRSISHDRFCMLDLGSA